MNTVLYLIIACGALSIVYGIWAVQSVMSADAGNKRMQEIAGAIQEGAQAYLTRQYTTIAIAGVIIFIVVAFLLSWNSVSGVSRHDCGTVPLKPCCLFSGQEVSNTPASLARA